MKYKVFVYGTLRRGQRANYLMDGKFLYSGVVKGYQLYWYNLGGFPFVVKEDGCWVVGEVFEVEGLEELDFYEGVDDGLYTRKVVLVHIGDTNKTELVFMYVGASQALLRYGHKIGSDFCEWVKSLEEGGGGNNYS